MIHFLTLLRMPFAVVFGFLFTAILTFVSLFLAVVFPKANWSGNVIHFWASGLLKIIGVRVRAIGVSNVPLETGVVYLFNHVSLIDIPVLFLAAPTSMRFGAKIELFSIPVFGAMIRATGFLPIARENRAETLKVYEGARKRLESGECFALAPEGTRQEEAKIGAFKSGPFVLAINAKAQIVPVVIVGLDAVLPKKSLLVNVGSWTREVQVEFLPTVAASEYSFETREQLKNQVRQAMVCAFDSLQAANHDRRLLRSSESVAPIPHR